MVTSGKGHVYNYTHDNSLHIEVYAHMIHIILDLLIKTQNNSVLLSHYRPARRSKLVEQGVTIYKLNDLSIEKIPAQR